MDKCNTNREPGNTLICLMVNYSLTKEAETYNGEKTVSSANGVGTAGQLHVNQ